MWHVWRKRQGQTAVAGRPDEKRPLERPRRKWEDIKMAFRKKVRWEN